MLGIQEKGVSFLRGIKLNIRVMSWEQQTFPMESLSRLWDMVPLHPLLQEPQALDRTMPMSATGEEGTSDV